MEYKIRFGIFSEYGDVPCNELITVFDQWTVVHTAVCPMDAEVNNPISLG